MAPADTYGHVRSGQLVAPRKRALQILAESDVCTLATASTDGPPEAATVRFVADDDLDAYVTTQSFYREYRNMTRNPNVAVVVDGVAGNP